MLHKLEQTSVAKGCHELRGYNESDKISRAAGNLSGEGAEHVAFGVPQADNTPIDKAGNTNHQQHYKEPTARQGTARKMTGDTEQIAARKQYPGKYQQQTDPEDGTRNT